jgi:hypothetical protein
LIGTFSKPVRQPSPKSQQYVKPGHFATVKLKEYSPNATKGMKGEVPAPKMGGFIDSSISSISN